MFKTKSVVCLLALMVGLSACQNSGSPVPAAPTGNVGPQGPGHGGGGNICNGKMIESYRVEVATLPEYTQFLAPLMEKLTPKKDGKESGTPFLLTPRSKNWYMIDCALDQVPKETHGLYFETHQVAVHRTHEIFIDGVLFNKMVPEEKAKLLLHELIMSFYLMKYLTIGEICKMGPECNTNFEAIEKWKLFRPQPYRPLNDIDHQKIRAVTAWVWENRETLKPAEFTAFIEGKDFDKRFKLSEPTETKEVEIEPAALVRMLKRYEWTKQFPKYCAFDSVTAVSTSACQTSITAEIRSRPPFGGVTLSEVIMKVKIVRASDQKILEQEFVWPFTNGKVRLHVNRIGDVINSAPFGAAANWPNTPGVELKEGLRSQMLLIHLNLADIANPEIYQVQFESYVWYDIEENIVVKDGLHYKETYAHRASVNEDSETTFTESTLPFIMRMSPTSRDFIRSELVAPPSTVGQTKQ